MIKELLPGLLMLSSVVISGCGYSKYRLEVLDDASFADKRCNGSTVNIYEFIRPEETREALDNIPLMNLSQNKDENKVLNILQYVQNVKQTNDKKDFWQYPSETLEKGGDCEDKVFLLLSMLIQAGINDAEGVKGRLLGGGHMWVEYKGRILDPSKKTAKLEPISKCVGYVPLFKFNNQNLYYCNREEK